MILRNTLHVDKVGFQLQERFDVRQNDTDEEVVVRKLDVARIEEFGHHCAGLFRIVCLFV